MPANDNIDPAWLDDLAEARAMGCEEHIPDLASPRVAIASAAGVHPGLGGQPIHDGTGERTDSALIPAPDRPFIHNGAIARA